MHTNHLPEKKKAVLRFILECFLCRTLFYGNEVCESRDTEDVIYLRTHILYCDILALLHYFYDDAQAGAGNIVQILSVKDNLFFITLCTNLFDFCFRLRSVKRIDAFRQYDCQYTIFPFTFHNALPPSPFHITDNSPIVDCFSQFLSLPFSGNEPPSKQQELYRLADENTAPGSGEAKIQLEDSDPQNQRLNQRNADC